MASVAKRSAWMLSDPENVGTRQQHINFDTLGTWDNRIDFNLLLKPSIKHGKPIPKISTENVGFASALGRRTTNEDIYNVTEINTDLLYFAVFDGHGGQACVQYCNENMINHIKYWLERQEKDLQLILEKAFIEVNNSFARFVTYNPFVETKNSFSGTTATVCLLRNGIELVVGHCGDSRALLCRNGQVMRLTNDHNANVKAEKERIVKSHGFIKNDSLGVGLVNGRLAMTRSIGDLDLKPYGVIALPDTRSIEIKHGKDAFVILTSDGINYVMSDQEVVDAVQSCGQPSEAAQFVTDQALHYACQDNATALVVPFGAWGKYKNHRNSYNQFYNFGRELSNSTRF
ncbi:protein phosphatase 1K, mitochondrial-like [Oppia nitens]|uniref:protein phosphatase 1K, mitochondrial-like n=1 Tax=Oppia nitens TaxID=1686743 RepID=UPI0023DB6697|nr:protein phosphatase 1K, mitochondrial-like [Oppia nitens]